MPGSSPDPDTDTVRCAADDLLRYTVQILRAVGMRAADARDMAAQIVDSELSGHESHGLRRLAEYVQCVDGGGTDPAATPVIDLDRGALARIDGRRGFGHIVVRDATALAVERAKRHGIAAVAVHHSDFAGRFATFCQDAAAAGIATLVFVNDAGGAQDVAPPGGLEARMATNPIAAGVPRAGSPHLVIDLATSAVAMGRLSEWRDRGEPIPDEWVTEQGALKSMAGAKGFGLALIAEALAGALSTAGTVRPDPGPGSQGVLIVAIDVDALRPLADFTAEVESFTGYLKDTPVGAGRPAVRIPGEGSAVTAATRRAHGVPIQHFTWLAMGTLGDRFRVRLPTAA